MCLAGSELNESSGIITYSISILLLFLLRVPEALLYSPRTAGFTLAGDGPHEGE